MKDLSGLSGLKSVGNITVENNQQLESLVVWTRLLKPSSRTTLC